MAVPLGQLTPDKEAIAGGVERDRVGSRGGDVAASVGVPAQFRDGGALFAHGSRQTILTESRRPVHSIARASSLC